MLIENKEHRIEVSPDAFNSMYKRLGYQEVKKVKPQVKEEAKTEVKPEVKAETKTENKNGNK